MGVYQTNRAWSDRMLPQIKRIVGPHLLEASEFELDAKQATDLIVLNARDMRVAARVRRPGYADKYPFDFTIRSKVASGTETELAKIINGFGDMLFYGHADSNDVIQRWFLIDLHSFRAALIRCREIRNKCEKRENGDGTEFYSFDVRWFPETPALLLASSHQLSLAA